MGRGRADPARGAGVQDPRREHRRLAGEGGSVFVHGTVTTEAWADNQTGEKRTAQRVLAEIVGPSLRWATTRITKTSRSPVRDETPHDVSEHEA